MSRFVTPLRTAVLQDWSANAGRPNIQLLLALFRLAQAARANSWPRPLSVVATALYRGFALAIASVDVPVSTSIGPRFRIHHGFGLVIHDRAVLGEDVTVRHGTTIGTAKTGATAAPRIGDRVSIGASALVIGDVKVDADAVIGAGAVVVRDVGAGCVVAGNPARVLGTP
jgi:serine acetyltransferase